LESNGGHHAALEEFLDCTKRIWRPLQQRFVSLLQELLTLVV